MKIPSKLPYVFQNNVKKVVITNGTGEIEDGCEIYNTIYEGPCNLSQSSKRVQNAEGLWVPLVGVIHIQGDIDKNSDVISCNVELNGNSYKGRGHKVRNPDGSINHTYIALEG